MKFFTYTHEQLINVAQITREDIEQINQCRRQHNRLGFGYQLAFVRLANRFPSQQPFEILDDVLTFVSVQLNIPSTAIYVYTQRQPTISEHQENISNYLRLRRFEENVLPKVKQFIFEEACRLEQASALLARTAQFLKEQGILRPSEDTLQRLIANQREGAKRFIFKNISGSLTEELKKKLDELLVAKDNRLSELNFLKQPPGRPSPPAMLKLTNKIETIEKTGILELDLSWLNNNYQRSLTHYAKRYTATKIRRLTPEHRYTVLVCFLWQIYHDTVDFIVDMYDKLVNKIYNHAQNDIDNHTKKLRKKIRQSLANFKILGELLLDDSIEDSKVRQVVFTRVEKEELIA